ncbi:MAG TPA: patatin-like phospholipase family protein [Nitrososphaeraceae archaeon]
MSNHNDFQRALIFQGGGSLGAYEAGAYKAFYELLSERDKKLGREDHPLFDIVAGTSIGSMNAAVLVSYVKENKTWKGSPDRLIEFWEYMATDSAVDKVPGFNEWWDYWHYFNNNLATAESARRYYGTKRFIFEGVPHVFTPTKTVDDRRFLDPANTWYLYSNEPLKKSLEKFANFPIVTSYQEKEPRLLLVALDVQEGLSVVFDSYEKADGSRKTEYGRYGPEFAREDNKNEDYEFVIRYDKGIEVDFVLASGSVPVNYDYTRIPVEEHDKVSNDNDNYNNKKQNEIQNEGHKLSGNNKTVRTRHFWDGGIVANTPLRDAVLEHRRYWHYVKKSKPPILRACIINVHPIRQDSLPANYDALIDRKNDLTYHDRTLFDERMAIMFTDYVNLTERLIRVAVENGVNKAAVDDILKEQTLTRNFMTGKHFKYADLIDNAVTLDFVFRIERKNDIHTIANKTFDFSDTTIRQLIKDGYEEALEQGSNLLRQFDSEHPRINRV